MMTAKTKTQLNFDPHSLKRELNPFYISASESDINEMRSALNVASLHELYSHIPNEVKFQTPPELPESLPYDELIEHLAEISKKNTIRSSFIGDGLQQYKIHEIVPYVSSIRGLTTAYTPYQPEYSQGTLITLWIYQCMISALTGFEAVNASLYDRASTLFEAMRCAARLSNNKTTIVLSEGILPQDLDVVRSLSSDTELNLIYAPLDKTTGTTCFNALNKIFEQNKDTIAGFAFTQINQLGLLEDVDALTDFGNDQQIKRIAIIDPMLLASGGLKPPTEYGSNGADIIVGEGQHLAIGPNFGGPGLGIFGVRYNTEKKNDIRSAPGRFIGKALDIEGRDVLSMVLSTREQHIRREKATSNICSNQSFLASLAGASILARGEEGMKTACLSGFNKAQAFTQRILKSCNVKIAFPDSVFFNEVALELPTDPSTFIQEGLKDNLHVGIDLSSRVHEKRSIIKVSFSDLQTEEEVERLAAYFESRLGENITKYDQKTLLVPENLQRKGSPGLPDYSLDELKEYYAKLGSLNLNVDNAPYPLGSCTMKYNPYINDWAANLNGFAQIHPQAPIEDIQGSLEVLYQIQEWFKKITGLAGATTQPVAGAQGELIALKMFQAAHRQNGDKHRDILFIPKSSHGTNFATAVMAGFKPEGIIQLGADASGLVDIEDFNKKIETYGNRVAGIMVTNPNTSGLFEINFKKMADAIHKHGGFVFMDGANMNAIAGWVNLNKLGVDAVHQNLHKTWTIPHGGGGPGDAIVAVSEKLIDFLPGKQVVKAPNGFVPQKTKHSIGTFHRHWGNFGHKIRCYSYLCRMGREGIPKMSSTAVLCARYMCSILIKDYATLPSGAESVPRMHEFILTLSEADFDRLEKGGIPKNIVIPRIGKLFLDFGYHAPTVAFPETFGLMIEPTESFSKTELDRLAKSIVCIKKLLLNKPELLNSAPHFAPISRIDEVSANRKPILNERPFSLPKLNTPKQSSTELLNMDPDAIYAMLIALV